MKKWLINIKNFIARNKKTIAIITVLNYTIKAAIILILLLKGKDAKAQSVNTFIRNGNQFYKEQKYNQATEQYASALQKEPNNSIAIFNQAAAMYQLGEYDKAETYFDGLAKQSKNHEMMSKSFHNLGNAFYKKEDYEKSVAAYKQALKLNPKDVDTKYNLMMAMSKLKNNQNQQNKENQQNKDQQKNKDKQPPKDQNNNQQAQNKDQQQSASKPQQDKKQGMSKEEADRLLEALGNEENKTQQKVGKQKGEPQQGKVKKDW